jgi:transcriptional regulator with XRE-family HTH domain
MKDVGTILRVLRKNEGMSQKKFAEKVGITYRTLQAYELGEASPQVDMLEKMLAVFGWHIIITDDAGMKDTIPLPSWKHGKQATFSDDTAALIIAEHNYHLRC